MRVDRGSQARAAVVADVEGWRQWPAADAVDVSGIYHRCRHAASVATVELLGKVPGHTMSMSRLTASLRENA